MLVVALTKLRQEGRPGFLVILNVVKDHPPKHHSPEPILHFAQDDMVTFSSYLDTILLD
jgi:hypothetical protein